MQELLLRLWRDSGKQILLITHDIEEAVFLASELILLSPGPGRIVERLALDFGRRYAAEKTAGRLSPIRHLSNAVNMSSAGCSGSARSSHEFTD